MKTAYIHQYSLKKDLQDLNPLIKEYEDDQVVLKRTQTHSNFDFFEVEGCKNPTIFSHHREKSISFDDSIPYLLKDISEVKRNYIVIRIFGKANLFLHSQKILNGSWIYIDKDLSVIVEHNLRQDSSYLKIVDNSNNVYYNIKIEGNIAMDRRYSKFFVFDAEDHYAGLHFHKMLDSYLFKNEIDVRNRQNTESFEKLVRNQIPRISFVQTSMADYLTNCTKQSFRMNRFPDSWKYKFNSFEMNKIIDENGNIVMFTMNVVPKDSYNLYVNGNLDSTRFNAAKDILYKFIHGLVKDVPPKPLKIKKTKRTNIQTLEENPRDVLMDQIKGITLNCLKKTNRDSQTKIMEDKNDPNSIHNVLNTAMSRRRKDLSDDEVDDDDW